RATVTDATGASPTFTYPLTASTTSAAAIYPGYWVVQKRAGVLRAYPAKPAYCLPQDPAPIEVTDDRCWCGWRQT
ncbi:MAG: hypothetical protein ACM3ZE_10485, partial [Myxococcales bacterium]